MTDEVYHQIIAARNKADAAKATDADRAELRRLYDVHPKVWQAQGQLAVYAQNDLIDHIKGAWSVKESVRRTVIDLRAQLGYDSATAIERLLIEQVVICWIRLQCQELIYTAVTRSGEPVTLTKAEHEARMLTSVQHRYLRAVETLARVRRLLHLPGPQLNISVAGQQLNIADQRIISDDRANHDV